MLLSITNLTTHDVQVQDPSGLSGFSETIKASSTKTGLSVSIDQLGHLEPELNALVASSTITWTAAEDPASLADNPPESIRTVLTQPDTALKGDDIVLVNLTVAHATSVVLPVSAPIGKVVTVVDKKGDANTNNITITIAAGGTINGGASFILNVAQSAARLLKVSATAWVAWAMGLTASAPTGAAGGDLTGAYPNPTLADASVDTIELVAFAVTGPKIAFATVTGDKLAATLTGPEQLLAASGAHPVDVTHLTTRADGATATDNITSTLADGAFDGQCKTLVMSTITGGKTWVVSPTNFLDGTQIAFSVKFDSAVIQWSVSLGKWFVRGLTGAAAVS